MRRIESFIFKYPACSALIGLGFIGLIIEWVMRGPGLITALIAVLSFLGLLLRALNEIFTM